MAQTAANPYLRTKVMTASPQQLRMMLYDGAIRFCRQARHALGQRDWEASFTAIVRAQKIVMELNSSLNHKHDPDLCDKLTALYNYIYRLLVDANLKRDTEPLDEAIGLIDYQRETWVMLMKKSDQPGARDAHYADDHAAPTEPLANIGPAAGYVPARTGGFSIDA